MRIGIDLGGTKTEGVVIDDSGTELSRRRTATPTAGGYSAILDNIVSLVGQLEKYADAPCRIGLGTPGAVSLKTGLVKNANTTCLNGRPLKEDLSERLEREIRIENDANCFALAEATDGAGTGKFTVFGIIMGTGVGGGVVVNRQLLPGLQKIAGEWGHNSLNQNGPPCYCGRRGCVEMYLSGPALAADYIRRGGITTSTHTLAARATSGDPNAQATLDQFLSNFGRALATVINILDPDVVVLGGGLSAIDGLYTRGRTETAQHVFTDSFTTPIVRNLHGDSAGVLGAARLWPS